VTNAYGAQGDELGDNEPLSKEISIKASPEQVFSFLSQHDKFLRWMGRTLEIDARPGGIFRLDPNGKEIIRGEFLEVAPPHRIVFTWGFEVGDMDAPPGSTVVELTLTPDGDGTILRLMHRDLPREGDVRPRHAAGWTHHLGRLQIAAEGGDPGADSCHAQEPNVCADLRWILV
jgi:uncharacterized protein YndB with AHSA1/START domain